jgi:hypothetical protein
MMQNPGSKISVQVITTTKRNFRSAKEPKNLCFILRMPLHILVTQGYIHDIVAPVIACGLGGILIICECEK